MKRFFCLSIFTVIAHMLQAQTNNGLDRPYRYYATQEVMQRIWNENPKLKANILQIEAANNDFKRRCCMNKNPISKTDARQAKQSFSV